METDDNARLIVESDRCLSEAVLSGQTESVKSLIRGGADINAQRDDGKSPLNVASEKGFTDIVRILIDNDADIENRDNDGRRPTSLLHDLLSSPISHHCVWRGITGHSLTTEKRDNNYTSHPLVRLFIDHSRRSCRGNVRHS